MLGLEDAAGTPAWVMELIEGPTLAERIAQRGEDEGDPRRLDAVIGVDRELRAALGRSD